MKNPHPKIWLSPPHMGGDELKFVHEAFATNWISPVGPHINAFEEELAAYVGIPHCAALSSGTAAIHLGLIILGVRAGDEVICSTFTFSGSCNPIAYLGAIPVFVDSERETWNMDPDLLEEAILNRIKNGKKPKAIIVVHLYGMPARIDRLMEIANRHDIPVVEDAAEALGSTYLGRKLGTWGTLGVYSFNGNKIMTTSGGGALVSENGKFIQKARFLSTQAREPFPHYEHREVGYNYRLSNVSAAIGRGQLRVLDSHIQARRENFEFYKRIFQAVSNVHLLEEFSGAFCNRWLTCIILQRTDNQEFNPHSLRLFLESENIESRPLWKPMHRQPVFAEAPAFVSGVAEELFANGLCLPSGSNLSPAEFDRLSETLGRWLVTHAPR